jgi:hypothetical protein
MFAKFDFYKPLLRYSSCRIVVEKLHGKQNLDNYKQAHLTKWLGKYSYLEAIFSAGGRKRIDCGGGWCPLEAKTLPPYTLYSI